jgi:hypothetical protein
MVFNGERFFGQDRIDVLVWRMKQKGLNGQAHFPSGMKWKPAF